AALARGSTLQALQARGWQLVDRSGASLAAGPAKASDRAADLGLQDLVVIAVKGPALGAVAAAVAEMTGPDTVVLPAMNGVPWWFCSRVGGDVPAVLQSVDPGGRIAGQIADASVLGCVVHISALVCAPGVVQHQNGNRLIVGEPGGGHSARSERIVSALRDSGLEVDHSSDVRRDIWFKLWGNLTMNPISALTGATVDRILGDPLVRAFCSAAMAEASQVGARIGCPIEQSPEERHAVTARLGAFKTSMLQDVEAGRAIELDAIVGAVQEIARGLGMATPSIDALLGLTRLMARTRGLYPPEAP
ncbi:MAG: 2-dehydropantoate 2-reductase, partial [Rubrivivax sp.]|nr:2-dehydropantoate 2-reductase [Rubrivivax sp.]